MTAPFRLCVAALMAVAIAGCQATPLATPPEEGRGHEPWVFRSVLDGRPRVVTVALRPDLYVAYDTENAVLLRAWRGDVIFDGPVYNEVHGPQPISVGTTLFGGGPTEPWSMRGPHARSDDADERLGARYRGHRLEHDRVWLHYELRFPDGSLLDVLESPEATTQGPRSDLERRFRVEGLPEESELRLALPPTTPAAALALTLESLARARLDTSTRTPTLVFTADGESTMTIHFDDAAAETGASTNREPARRTDEQTAERLLQQHGCQSCHSRDARTVGPSLVEIAERYPWTPAVRDQLVWKVATGGGSFGDTPMRSHPELSEETRQELVDWILSLDGEPAPDPEGSGLGLGTRIERRIVRWAMHGFSWWYALQVEVIDPIGERAGDGRKLDGVHPSFDLEAARPSGFAPRVGGMAFLPDGRLALCTWDPEGAVYLLDGLEGNDAEQIEVRKIASGLAEPLGLAAVGDDLYVLQKQELTRLIDRDGDGTIDEYRAISADWDVSANFHEFAFGLAERDGFLYAALATAVLPGGKAAPTQTADRGSVLEIALADGRTRVVARGLRTPNGIGIGPGGEILVADNQGDWLPSSKLVALREGAFYGSRAVDPAGSAALPVMPPIVWLPQDEIGNSPSQPVPLDIAPYSGQILLGDVTHGGIKRVALDPVDGELQGAVFRFTQGLEAGVNRLAWGPDGKLYAGGIGNPGNWNTPGGEWAGLQRLAWNGRPAFEILAVRALHTGFEIELTEALADGRELRPDDLAVTQWRYEPTANYGGPKVDVEALPVSALRLGPERRRLIASIEGLSAGRVVHLRLRHAAFENARGDTLWSPEAWYTLNRIPAQSADAASAPALDRSRPGDDS